MERKILVCEDSLEGVFSGIYEAYARKYKPEDTTVQVGEEDNYRLFSEYESIEADAAKAGKVSNTIIREFGTDTYLHLCKALATEDREKGDAVYRTVALALQSKCGQRIMERLTDDYVNKVLKLSIYTTNEILHLEGFLRFEELENGILFAAIGPRNNILTFLAPHFADRLPLENFVIYDEKRSLFAVHPKEKEWFLLTGDSVAEEKPMIFSDKEMEYQELFTYFCHKIAIKERKNLNLQRQMLPIRFQEYMVEFRKSVKNTVC